MAQVMVFPSKFDRKFFRDLDREFAIIFALTFAILVGLTARLQGLPPKELTQEEILKYQRVIYRVKPAPTRTVTETTEAPEEAEAVEEAEVVEEEEEEEAPVEAPQTEVDKQAKREREKEARRQRRTQEMKQAEAAAAGIKTLVAPTARGRGRSSSRRRSSAVQLGAGSVKGFDSKKITGVAGDEGTIKKVRDLKASGAISGDIGDIDVTGLGKISADELELMLDKASVQMPSDAITASGRGASAQQRSQSAISKIVMQNQNQVQYCFWTYKKRDSSLKGRVVVQFTIEAGGEVSRVRFRESEWGGNPLGSEVERCITNLISSWRFEPIDPGAGSVRAGATYIFAE